MGNSQRAMRLLTLCFLLLGAAAAVRRGSFDDATCSEDVIQASENKGAEKLMAHLKTKYGGKIPEGVDVLAEMNDTENREASQSTNRRKLLGAAIEGNGSFDWKQCISEGGSKNCALCNNAGGVLPCDKPSPSNKASACPDNKILKTGSYFRVRQGGAAVCHPTDALAARVGTAQTTWKYATLGDSLVLTKSMIAHPALSHKKVGVFMFKRIVSHKCTGHNTNACKKGSVVTDVVKLGWCIQCDYDVFSDERAARATDEQRKDFMTNCVPKAIDANGAIKKDYKCTGDDERRAGASIAGF